MDKYDLQIIIPYAKLQELLEAPQDISKLRTEVQLLSAQVTSLRGIQFELMELIRDLKAEILKN